MAIVDAGNNNVEVDRAAVMNNVEDIADNRDFVVDSYNNIKSLI